MDRRASSSPGAQERASTDSVAARWWAIAQRTWEEAGKDNLDLVAAGIAYNAFFAMVPLLTAVVLSYGLIASPEEVAQDIAMLAEALPEEAAAIIGNQLQGMVASAGTAAGFGLALSLMIALYGALRGATGIMAGLDIVYGIEDSRSFLRRTTIALAITVGLVVLFLLASAALSIVAFLAKLLPGLGSVLQTLLQLGFWLGAAATISFVIARIYAYAPDRENTDRRWLTPGSAMSTIVWIAATLGFSFYVRNFGSYNATYGALGAVIIFLTWLYLSAYMLLLGAELNEVLSGTAPDDG